MWNKIVTIASDKPALKLAGASAIVLILLFRQFIFSNNMLMAHDVIESAIPYLKFLKDYFAAHHGIPLWDPYHFCGIPFIDAIHGHSGALYPFTFISLIGSIPRAIGFNMILHYLAATVFAYLAARQFGLRQWPAAIVAFAYGLSPTLVSWVYPGHDGKLFVAAWFPLAIYLTERLRTSPSLSRAIWLGLVIAVSILTPHLQAVLYVLIFLLLFSIFHVAFDLFERQPPAKNVRFVIWMAVAAVIGLGVSSVQWIPGYRHISEFSPRAEEERGVAWASTYSLNGEELISIAVPEFSGVNIIGKKYAYWGKNEFKDNSEAAGVLPCLLALLAFLVHGFRRQKILWLSTALLVVLYSLGNSTPVFRLILAIVPPLNRMRAPSTSMFVAVFAIAMLAGIGTQNLVDRLQDKAGRFPRTVKFVLMGSTALFLIVWLVSLFAGKQLVTLFVLLFHSQILPHVGGGSDKWQLALNNLSHLRTGFFVGAAVSAGAVVVFFVGRFRKWQNIRLLGLSLLLVVSLYQFDQRFVLTISPERFFSATPVSKYLRTFQDMNRTVGYPVPTRWYNLTYQGIYSPGGVNDKALSWYVDLIGGRAQNQLLNPRVMNLTGTHYMIAPASQQISQYYAGPEPLQVAMRYDQTVVHRNDNSFPRAYFASDVRVMENLKAIDDSVQAGHDNLHAIVYLEKDVALQSAPVDSALPATATIISYTPDSVAVAVSAKQDRVLVLTDTYHPDWVAYVDGLRSDVLRAYGAFRAVVVPAGSSLVVFRYEDHLHTLTLMISLGILACCCVLLAGGWLRRRRATA